MELIVRLGDRLETVRVEPKGEGYEVHIGDEVHQVDAVASGGGRRSLLLGGQQFELDVHRLGSGRYNVAAADGLLPSGGALVEVTDPLTHLARQARGEGGTGGSQQVTAYMPGRVTAVLAAEGDKVEAGQGIVVLEAMKMENEIQAECAGLLKRVLVEAGQAVEGGDPLFEIEAEGA